jgi:hypothetical protein
MLQISFFAKYSHKPQKYASIKKSGKKLAGKVEQNFIGEHMIFFLQKNASKWHFLTKNHQIILNKKLN